jgi:hypothetical protein
MQVTFIPAEEIPEEEKARHRAQNERFRRNSEWLQAHAAELWPLARGKHLAVAGQEAFIGDTTEEAWGKAKAAHPEDDGAFCQYVYPEKIWRIYASRG